MRKYKKIHNRARDYIDDYLESAKVPIQVPQLKHQIREEVQLTLSKSMINRYLKCELGLSYNKIKPITAAHNKLQAKLQR